MNRLQIQIGKAKLIRDGRNPDPLVRHHDMARSRSGQALVDDRVEWACCTFHDQTLNAETILREAVSSGRLVVVARTTLSLVVSERRRRTSNAVGIYPTFRQIGTPDDFLDAGALRHCTTDTAISAAQW